MASLLRSAANPRFDLVGLARQLGTDPDTLTADWHAAITQSAAAVISEEFPYGSDVRQVDFARQRRRAIQHRATRRPRRQGDRLLFRTRPFLHRTLCGRRRFGPDLRKLSSSATDPHFDSLEFLNSAGAWSPDGRTLAIGAIKSGNPVSRCSTHTRDGCFVRSRSRGSTSVESRVFAGRHVVGVQRKPWRFHGPLSRPRDDVERCEHDGRTVDQGPCTQTSSRCSCPTAAASCSSPNGSVRISKHSSPGPFASRASTLPATSAADSGLPERQASEPASQRRRLVDHLHRDPDGISNLYRISIDGGPITQLTSMVTGIAGITTSSPH